MGLDEKTNLRPRNLRINMPPMPLAGTEDGNDDGDGLPSSFFASSFLRKSRSVHQCMRSQMSLELNLNKEIHAQLNRTNQLIIHILVPCTFTVTAIKIALNRLDFISAKPFLGQTVDIRQ
jgi:hypothetical protein